MGTPPPPAGERLALRRGGRLGELRFERDHVGVVLGIATRTRVGELALNRRETRARRAEAGGGTDARNGLRRAGHLAVDRGEARLRGGEIAVDLAHLCARRADAVADAAGAGERAEIAVLEIGALRLGVLQRFLALLELLVEKGERLRILAAVVGQILFDENVDQFLGDRPRELRRGRGRRDLEQIVLLRDDLDRGLQPRDAIGDVAVVRHGLRKIGAAHDLFEIDRGRERLADRIDIVLIAVRRWIVADRQHRMHLDEDAGARFVPARHLADEQPAEHADPPRDRHREPPARPDRVERDPQFVVQAVH